MLVMTHLKIIQGKKKALMKYVSELVSIDRDCFETRSWEEKHFLAYKKNKFKTSLLALYDDRLAGYIIASEYLPKLLHIHRFAVDKKFRGMGIGKSLLESFINYAFLKYNKITVETDACFFNAIHLYEKFGFIKLNQAQIIEYLINKQKISELSLYNDSDHQQKKRLIFVLDII